MIGNALGEFGEGLLGTHQNHYDKGEYDSARGVTVETEEFETSHHVPRVLYPAAIRLAVSFLICSVTQVPLRPIAITIGWFPGSPLDGLLSALLI
jgi:hypothetical protein